MVSRRSFIGGTLALWFGAVAAQEKKPGRVFRVGVLDPLPLSSNASNMEQLRKGLRDAGYTEGENLTIEYRASDGRAGRYQRMANELARLPVDVLVARGTPAALGARNASKEMPIVAVGVTDPAE